MEAEQANFSQNHMNIRFNDPVLTLPEKPGRLILRIDDYEAVIKIKDITQYTFPFESLARKTTLTAIFIAENGLAATAEIHIQGKRICRIAECTF